MTQCNAHHGTTCKLRSDGPSFVYAVASRGNKTSVSDMVAPIDVERFTGNEPRCVVRQKGGCGPYVINADEAARGCFRFRFIEQGVKFGDAGCCSSREWPRRDRMTSFNPDRSWQKVSDTDIAPLQ